MAEASTATGARDRLLVSFTGLELAPAAADAIARRASGVTLYRSLNIDTPAQVRALTDDLQAAARRVGVSPLVIGADHETGQLHAMGPGATPFAGAMALGAVADVGLTERVGRAIGTELRAMGVTLCYAPVCDLATNPWNPVVGIRAFGDDGRAVGGHAAAMVRGLQSAGVAAAIKHLPGHGDPTGDTHVELPVVERSRAEMEARELVPFRAAITAGARVAMAGHLAVPALTGRRDLPATMAPEVLTQLLRDELHFDGLAVSDALDMGAVLEGGGVDVARALAAGVDLLLCGPDSDAQVAVEAGLAAAARMAGAVEGSGSVQRLDVLRSWLAGYEQPSVDVVGSAAHRALAEELAGRSITLVRDRAGLIPFRLADDLRILVIEPRPRLLTPADTTADLPAGGLAATIAERHARTEGVVVEAQVSDGEIGALVARARDADVIVLGTVDAMRESSVPALARALVDTARPVVAVALRGPWDADAYPEVATVVATYGIQPPTLAALARALVGDVPLTGKLPVRLRTRD